MTEPAAARAVVSDDGAIRLTLYGDQGAVATVTLPPVRSFALAGELIGGRCYGCRQPNL